MSTAPSNRLQDQSASAAAARSQDDLSCDDAGQQNRDLSPEESAQLRAEKLKAIRRAIDAGDYDSDEILAEAMQRMRKSIEDVNDETEGSR